MSALFSNEGEVKLLTDLLSAGEDWSWKLYKSATTPSELDTAGTYTESTFTGYASTNLVRGVGSGHWSTPASGSPTGSWSGEAAVAESTYGASAITYSATSGESVIGYYVVGASSGKLLWAEKFASAIVLVNPSTLTIQPRIGAS